jgi:dimethylglycine dehydrogenase
MIRAASAAYATKEWQVVKAEGGLLPAPRNPVPAFQPAGRAAGQTVAALRALKAKGAVHEEVYGFERPRWFARMASRSGSLFGFRRTVVDDMVAEKCKAVRERVGIMDITAFTKVDGRGPGCLSAARPADRQPLPQKPAASR